MLLTLYFIIGLLAYIVKHLGQTKERKTALAMGFVTVMIKSQKTLRMTMLRRWGCGGPGLRGGGLAINTRFARICN